MYKARGICQMHYFRFMRNGTYDLKDKSEYKRKSGKIGVDGWSITPNGYKKIYVGDHELSVKGYAFEHRYVLYEASRGKDLSCEFCGREFSFRPYKDHVDHIDNDKLNNSIENLRPLCNACNTRRTIRTPHEEKGKISLTYNGETKTPEEWGRDDRIPVYGPTIRQRLKAGWDSEKALTTPSRKGNNKPEFVKH